MKKGRTTFREERVESRARRGEGLRRSPPRREPRSGGTRTGSLTLLSKRPIWGRPTSTARADRVCSGKTPNPRSPLRGSAVHLAEWQLSSLAGRQLSSGLCASIMPLVSPPRGKGEWDRRTRCCGDRASDTHRGNMHASPPDRASCTCNGREAPHFGDKTLPRPIQVPTSAAEFPTSQRGSIFACRT